MQTAIGFVEYLVTGCLAMLWVRLAIPQDVLSALKFPETLPLNVMALAWIYVLGMLIDFISAWTVGRFKWAISDSPRKKPRELAAEEFWKAYENFQESAALVYLSKELGAEYDAKSTRDRIARGAVVNLVLVAVFAPLRMAWPTGWYVAASALAAAALSFGAWWQFQSSSYRHRTESLATVLWLRDKASIEKLAESARTFASVATAPQSTAVRGSTEA